MLLVRDMMESILAAMIADTDWLAHVQAAVSDVGLVPIMAPFTPSEGLTLGDLSLAGALLFDGNQIKLCSSATQLLVVDADGRPGIRLTEPLGGFTWTITNTPVTPWNVYGVALVQATGDVADTLMATASFLTPVPLTMAGQGFQVSSVVGFFTSPIFTATANVITP